MEKLRSHDDIRKIQTHNLRSHGDIRKVQPRNLRSQGDIRKILPHNLRSHGDIRKILPHNLRSHAKFISCTAARYLRQIKVPASLVMWKPPATSASTNCLNSW